MAGALHTWSPGAALTSEEPKKCVLVQNGSSFQVAGANPSSPAGPRVPSRGLLRSHHAFYQTLAQLNHSLPNYFRASLAAFAWSELFTGEAGPFLPAKLPLSFIALDRAPSPGQPTHTSPADAGGPVGCIVFLAEQPPPLFFCCYKKTKTTFFLLRVEPTPGTDFVNSVPPPPSRPNHGRILFSPF